MKGRNGAAKPPPKVSTSARTGTVARNGPPVETFSRFVRQLARLESERVKGGGEGPR